MLRRLVLTTSAPSSLSASGASSIAVSAHAFTAVRQRARRTEGRDAGVHDRAPRDGVDFEFTGHPDSVLPGAHPLPLNDSDVEASRWPIAASPFMPSPARVHPYFVDPPAELPFLECPAPIIYSHRVIKERIIVPVFSTGSSKNGDSSAAADSDSGAATAEAGTVTHTRELDPFIFGMYPDQDVLAKCSHYWMCRTQDYKATWELGEWEIFRKAKKNWPNYGTGMGRVSNRKNHMYQWGGRLKPNKPWNYMMPSMQPNLWQLGNRMALTLKMLQGKLMVVDKLSLDAPSKDSFVALCERMGWDVRHDGAGVLFVDGGSRVAPSVEFDPAFFYGSFYNGRCKLVRPTLLVDKPYDWNYPVRYTSWRGPRGQKNPVPLNRFNVYDALDHQLLVVTEGALAQFEEELEEAKIAQLPPHIAAQLPERGLLGSRVPRSAAAAAGAGQFVGAPAADGGLMVAAQRRQLGTMEQEAAGRIEERETAMYAGYYDNPYAPWADEEGGAYGSGGASYEVDAVDGFIKRHTPQSLQTGVPASWRQLG